MPFLGHDVAVDLPGGRHSGLDGGAREAGLLGDGRVSEARQIGDHGVALVGGEELGEISHALKPKGKERSPWLNSSGVNRVGTTTGIATVLQFFRHSLPFVTSVT